MRINMLRILLPTFWHVVNKLDKVIRVFTDLSCVNLLSKLTITVTMKLENCVLLTI